MKTAQQLQDEAQKAEKAEYEAELQRKKLREELASWSGVDVGAIGMVSEGFRRLYAPEDTMPSEISLGGESPVRVYQVPGELFDEGETEEDYWHIPHFDRRKDLETRKKAGEFQWDWQYRRARVEYLGAAGVRHMQIDADSFQKYFFGVGEEVPESLQLGKVTLTTGSFKTQVQKEKEQRREMEELSLAQ